MKPWLSALAFVGLLLLAAYERATLLELASPGDGGAPAPIPDAPTDAAGNPQLEATQGTGSAFDALGFLSYIDPMSLLPAPTDADANTAAFLMMLRVSEGTAGADGYATLFGGDTFSSFADHPRIAKQFTDQVGRVLWTTAAGAYQMMAVSPLPSGGTTHVDTWDRLKAQLSLPDFTPASQDAAALELIRQAGALGDVQAGRVDSAIAKVRRIWASLPGAGYAQGENSLASLEQAFVSAGGAIAS